jgi:hypothetical protein
VLYLRVLYLDKQLDTNSRVKYADATNQKEDSLQTLFLLCEMFHQQNKKQDELWLVLSLRIIKFLRCNQSIMKALESVMS